MPKPEIERHLYQAQLACRADDQLPKGVIGRVSDVHMAYAGNQFDLSTIRMDTGPAGARWLKEQGVDIALFTPV